MADYQKPQVRFLNHGQNWNRSVDTIPSDQWCYLRNIRSYVDGTMTSRPGLTTFVTLGTGSDYYTAISRLNNSNLPAFGGGWVFSYVLGLTQKLYVGTDAAHLTNATVNPVFTPLTPSPSGGNPFSGNPLSVVDMAPVGVNLSFKYIGDSNQNCSVGYYPGDTPNGGTPTMARCITMGMLPPVTQTIPFTSGSGGLNGSYQWRFVYRNKITGAQSNPSAATRVTVGTPGLTLTNQQAVFTLPTTPIDPQTGTADSHIVVDVYRFGGTIFRWKLVGTANSGFTFSDSLADSVILSAPEPSQASNPVSGIAHFNLFQPFVIQDVAHNFTANLTLNANGKTILTWTGGDQFAPGWLAGSVVNIFGIPVSYHIYQVIDATHIEVTEDLLAIAPGSGSCVVPSGNLRAGNPLRHLWGPWGLGQTGGSYIFGCGHPLAPGSLFWTNGNDPDSTDTYNSLDVTDPSEPLMNGCVYAGNTYVWSTERMFQILPSLTIPGQFVVQEMPGARGIWMEYSLEVQTTGFADISVSWRGKDGIYDFSVQGGLRSLSTDQMYPLFPHDNLPGIPLANLFPFLPNNVEPVGAPSDNNPPLQRLTWFDGYLFYDYLTVLIGPGATNNTLVWDSRVDGWVSVDLYTQNKQIVRGIEIAANNLKIGIGNVLYDYVGSTDNGANIPCRVVSRADDFGDGRSRKQLGDLMLDVNPAGSTVSANLLTNYHTTSTGLSLVTGSVRVQQIEDFASGAGIYSVTAGIDITFNSVAVTSPAVTLFQWELAYLVKPEVTTARTSDWDDDAYEGAKFLQGFVVQANTFGATAHLTLQYDCQTLGQTFTINTGTCEQEVPFSLQTPVITHMMRLSSDTPISMMAPFKIRWIWEPAPELTQYWITQGTSFGLRGYFQHRDVLMAIQSADVVTLTITPDNRASVSITFASTGGILLKPYSSLPPLKARIAQYSVTSPTGFRLYQKDVEVRVKDWGNTGPWQVVRPFGDLSFERGARI
jgi:hypothetical protein